MLLERMTSTEILALRGKLHLIVPLGSIEAHGAHLPLGTDSLIVSAVLDGLPGTLLERVVVCPPLVPTPVNIVRLEGRDGRANPRISSVIWANYACDVLLAYIGAYDPDSILLVTWHDTLDFIAAIRSVSHQVRISNGMMVDALRLWILAREFALANGICGKEERHAAKIETSLVQHLMPDAVRADRRANVAWNGRDCWAVDWRNFTEQGVYGNALESDPEIGGRILDHLQRKAAELVLDYFSHSDREAIAACKPGHNGDGHLL